MSFDPPKPQENSPLDAVEVRYQLNALKALIDALQTQTNGLLPVGFIGAWPKSRANVPALPGTWVECNGQVLNDPASPFHGQTMDDLNGVSGPQRFLRGAATGGSDTHTHAVDDNSGTRVIEQGSTFGVNDASSLPSYYEVVWVMRVK